jgi:hypothetical protein
MADVPMSVFLWDHIGPIQTSKLQDNKSCLAKRKYKKKFFIETKFQEISRFRQSEFVENFMIVDIIDTSEMRDFRARGYL